MEGQSQQASLEGGSEPAPSVALRYAKLFSSLVKLEHTVFALPFAYVGAFLALDGVPSAAELVWITAGDGGCAQLRNGAESAHRREDRRPESRARRGASSRAAPCFPGRSSSSRLGSLALFLVAVYQLAPIVGWLWPIPVAGFVLYPYLKRVTWLCHFWLGIVDGLAPVGAWAAVTNELPWQAWLLGAAVAVWIAGFDVLYALFDLDVDRAQGLQSFPARFGVPRDVHRLPPAARCDRGFPRRRPGSACRSGRCTGSVSRSSACLLAYEHALVSPTRLAPARHRLLRDERRHQHRRSSPSCSPTSSRDPCRRAASGSATARSRSSRCRPRAARGRLFARHGSQRLGQEHAAAPVRGSPAPVGRRALDPCGARCRSVTWATSRSSTGS